MYYQQQQSLVLPHHIEGLQYLPANFPPFFPGLAPQILMSNGITNLDLAGAIQRKLLKYIIESVKPQAHKPIILMYKILSSNEFQNQEFYNLVIMAMKCVNKLLSRGMDISRALDESYMNAAARWLVDYLKNNGQYFGLDHMDMDILGRIEQKVQMFESKFMGNNHPGQMPQQQQSYGGQHFPGNTPYPGTQGYQQHNQYQQQYNRPDVQSVIGGMYSNGQATSNSPSPYSDVQLNTGMILSALDAEDSNVKEEPGTNVMGLQGIDPSKIAEEFNNPYIAPIAEESFHEEPEPVPVHIPEPVPEPVKEVAPEPVVEETTQNDTNTKEESNVNDLPVVRQFGDGPVEFAKHDVRRLFRNGQNNVTPETSFQGSALLESVGDTRISLTANDPYPPMEGEVSPDADLGLASSKTVMLSYEERTVVNDDDLRVYLAGHLNDKTRSCITTVSYPELSSLESYYETILDKFQGVKTHEEISKVITGVINGSEDPSLIELFKIIDRRLCSIIEDVINFELCIAGNMDNYHGSILSVMEFLRGEVNDVSFDHVNDCAPLALEKALSGVNYGVLEDLVTVCFTSLDSSEFPYLIDLDKNDNLRRLARVNPMVTPSLHSAISKVFEYVDKMDDASAALLRKVQIMTFDGAKISLYRCPFTTCFNVLKETT